MQKRMLIFSVIIKTTHMFFFFIGVSIYSYFTYFAAYLKKYLFITWDNFANIRCYYLKFTRTRENSNFFNMEYRIENRWALMFAQ